MKNSVFTAIAFLFISIAFCLPVMLIAQCPEVVWEDEFDGDQLDLTKWNVQIGDGCDLGICGWGNNELQYYQKENIELQDGILKIVAKREMVDNKFYTSSRINTKGRGDWKSGRFEARMRMPTGRGLWPAFWMLSTGEPYGSWPQSGEIDIMELIGSEPDKVHGTIHFGRVPPNNSSSSADFSLREGDFSDDFHVFALEWDTDQLRWIIDGYLYSVKTMQAVGGSSWPFDHNFHILLNLAVGGNWPGTPDGLTQFPQSFDIDYVRVYDGYKPAMNGSLIVENQAKGVEYNLFNIESADEITWSVPSNATILSGQGTPSITVDWKDIGGAVSALISNNCQTDTLSVDVWVEPPLAKESSWENFDEPGLITFNSSTGILQDEVANPSKNDINSSDLCGLYTRDPTQQFDVLLYDITSWEDAQPFLDGEKRFVIDVYTDAPVGTLILLQLENSVKTTANNFPAGRHSRFEARTSKQNEWERLELSFLDQPDINTKHTAIDQLVFLFGSNTSLGSTFYFDNFDTYGFDNTVASSELKEDLLLFFPNPTSDYLIFDRRQAYEIDRVSVCGIDGIPRKTTWNRSEKINVSDLEPGVYMLVIDRRDGTRSVNPFIKKESR